MSRLRSASRIDSRSSWNGSLLFIRRIRLVRTTIGPEDVMTAGGAGGLQPDPARELLGGCAATYLDLAEKADGHAADVRLLLDGWPR